MPKPFFSIRIDYSPADDDSMDAFDSHSLRVSIARATQNDEDDCRDPNDATCMDIACRVVSAIEWLSKTVDPDVTESQNRLVSSLMFEMRMRFWSAFVDQITEVAEGGDDDELLAMKNAITNGERKSQKTE